MIRGAGRLTRMDERANYPTPTDAPACPALRSSGYLAFTAAELLAESRRLLSLYPAPSVSARVLPGRVMDGRHLFEQEQEHPS